MKKWLVLMPALVALIGTADAGSQGTLGLSVRADRYAGPTPVRVSFSATASGAKGAVRYRYCFDDGKQSLDRKPTHTFRRAGYYSVVVQAKDASGNTGRRPVVIGAWPPKQWADAQRQPITKQGAARAQRVQRRRTRARRKQLERRGGLTRSKCTGRPL
jgi:hypothetical protein